MIPVVHQIHSRTGPAATHAAQEVEVEVVGPTLARARPEVPPVGQADAVDKDMQLGCEGVDHSRRAESPPTPEREGMPGTASNPDGPQDRAVFRARVIRFLTAIYGEDEAFQRALKLGTIVIQAVEDQPEPEMRPELSYATYRHGAAQAQQAMAATDRQGGDQSSNIVAGDFIAWWPK